MLLRCIGSAICERIFFPAVPLPPEPAENSPEPQRCIPPRIVEGERAMICLIVPPFLDAIYLATAQARIFGNCERDDWPSHHRHTPDDVPAALRVKFTMSIECLPVCHASVWVWCAAALKFYQFGRHKLGFPGFQISAILNDCVGESQTTDRGQAIQARRVASEIVMAL